MNKPFAYIASPYSDPNPEIVEARVEIATKVTATLLNKGINAICPIVYGHSIVKKYKLPGDWNFWKNFLTAYLTCSYVLYVVMIDGWENSVGLEGEIQLAKDFGVPIMYVDPKDFE